MTRQSARCHQTRRCGGDTSFTKVAVVPIPVHEVDTDGRGHPAEKDTMTILKGLEERLSEDLFLSTELATSRCPNAGVQGVYCFGCRTCAVKGEKYPAPLEICSSCRAEMAAYDGAAKWVIFVASLAVTPPGGPPLRGWEAHLAGVHRVCTWARLRRACEACVAPTSKQATVADTTPSPESNSDGS